jgi:predicted nucleic acid-binding Zn ribbon protein
MTGVRRETGWPGERKAVPLGDALGGFLKRSGLAGLMKYPELHEAWQKTVGADIARHTRVSRFQRGALEIAVDSSALLNDIQFHKAALLQDMRREVKKPFISAIVFTHKPQREEDGGQ